MTDRDNAEVSFPFGYGLSYTTFSFNGAGIEKTAVGAEDSINLSVTVTNTGGSEGADVVQLYTGYPESKVLRHVKDLKAFKKVFLKPDESRKVNSACPFRISRSGTRLHQAEVERTVYTAYVGSSSRLKDLIPLQFEVR